MPSDALPVSRLTPRPIPVVEPETTMADALALMADEPLKAVVLIGDGTYMGILLEESARDLLPDGVSPTDLVVGAYVHPARIVLTPATPLEEALSVMTRRGMRVAPVVNNVRFLGVVTLEDVQGAA